jgi:putative DNA primase/helicase
VVGSPNRIARNSAPVNSAIALIEALDGDIRTGKCRCPVAAHDDQTPSLHVSLDQTAPNGSPLFHCFVCPQKAVLAALKARGLWPPPGAGCDAKVGASRHRSNEERRDFALKILADTRTNRGQEVAEFLDLYFAGRGIRSVPATAMLALPYHLNPYAPKCFVPATPAMVFEVTDGKVILGAHVTWLNSSATAKRDRHPQRQFFGPVSGGFIRLYPGELDPGLKLIIAEGVETAMAAAQLANLPAIAALSAGNLPKITPPPAREYIIAADHDGPGLAGARALAAKLTRAGHTVRLAIPSTVNSDWNDEVMR